VLAIFDMSSVNVVRYNSEFLRNTKEKYVAYVDDPNLCVDLKDSRSILICTAYWKISKLISSLQDNKISAIVISGQRPADLRILIASNKLGIPIIYKMHGLYVPHMKRSVSFFVSKFIKVFRTLFYLVDISIFTRNVSISIGMLSSFVFGVTRSKWASSEWLRVDVGLVWSEYWKAWHEEHWAMLPRSGWEITGNPDTVKFDHLQIGGDCIVYIYQTLVEDGRIDFEVMGVFYDSLQEIATRQNKTVHVKWHPRGDRGICEGLEDRGFHIHNELPIGGSYVGHYSSLLGVVPLMDGLVIIFELEGHPTPESIRECATEITSDFDVLERALKSNYVADNVKRRNAIYYFGDAFVQDVELSIIERYVNSKSFS